MVSIFIPQRQGNTLFVDRDFIPYFRRYSLKFAKLHVNIDRSTGGLRRVLPYFPSTLVEIYRYTYSISGILRIRRVPLFLVAIRPAVPRGSICKMIGIFIANIHRLPTVLCALPMGGKSFFAIVRIVLNCGGLEGSC